MELLQYMNYILLCKLHLMTFIGVFREFFMSNSTILHIKITIIFVYYNEWNFNALLFKIKTSSGYYGNVMFN